MTAPAGEPCEPLPWDSAHFGFPIARVLGEALTRERCEAIDAWCARAGIRCLYFRARCDEPATPRAAEQHGYRFVDVRVDYHRLLADGDPDAAEPAGRAALRAATGDDRAVLDGIVRKSYGLTRFYFDDNFPRPRVEALYATWLGRSLEGFADAVLVAGPVGRPAGLVTCHLPKGADPARIGLVGVAEQEGGRGVGRELILGALGWFRHSGVRRIEVATQARNRPAQRLYQRCGFLTERVSLWYHKWYP